MLTTVLGISLAVSVTGNVIQGIQNRRLRKRIEQLTKINQQLQERNNELAKQYEVKTFVLGYPKHMDNTIGERAQKSEAFKEKLERRTGIPVILWDERLTTVAADNAMDEAGLSREKKKNYVDMIAASLILQGYLDSLAFTKKMTETE